MRSFVVEVSPTVADDGSTATYLFGTQAWATKPTDTPANTVVRPLLKNAGTVRRELFSGARVTGAITPSYGNIVLANPAPEEGAAGDLDDWLGYGISGSKVVVRWGEIGDAYPGAWTTVYIAYAHSMVADVETITIRLRDRLQMLDQPAVVNGFAGMGGLEGNGNVSQKKQEVFGSPWFIAPILVDANRQIYFVQATTANVSGTFLAGISDWEFAVFDMGVRIENDAGQQYASAADIVSTSPTAGYARFYFGAPSLYGGPALDHPGYPGRRTGGVYFRLGSPPAGDVRVWAFGEPTDDDHARRGNVLRSWFAGTFAMRAGIDIADIEADTLTGFHRVVNDDSSYLDLLSDCALAANGWFGFTRLDKFRSGYLLDPESNNTYYNCPASIQPASATTSLYEFDGSQVKTLRREPVSGMDVPIWKASFTVGQTFPSNVANGADPEIRDYLTRDPAFTSFQGVSMNTLTSDPGAGTAQVNIRGMFATTQQAARLMAQRYLALYGGRRDFWTFSVPMADDVLALELHDVVTLKSPRFGLSAGRKHRIVGITIDCAAPVPQMRFVLWGGQAGLWTASTGGPGTSGYVRPGGATDPGITAAARNSIGDFTGYMAGSVVAAPSSMFGFIGNFTGYIIAQVLDVGSGWDTSQTGGAHTTSGKYLSSNGSIGRSFSVSSNSSGKKYAEIYVNDGYNDGYFGSPMVGVTRDNSGANNQQIYFNGTGVYAGWTSGSANPARYGREVYTEYAYNLMDSGLAMTGNCLVMIAMDLDTGKVWFGRDGSWQGAPAAGTGAIKTLSTGYSYYIHCYHGSNSTFSNYELHTKSSELVYSPPSGFSAWE